MQAPEAKVEMARLKREAEQFLSSTKLAFDKAASEREQLAHQLEEAERKLAFLTDELQRLSAQVGPKQAGRTGIGGFTRKVRKQLRRCLVRGGAPRADTPVPSRPAAAERLLETDRRPDDQASPDPQRLQPSKPDDCESDVGGARSRVRSPAKAPELRYPADFHRLASSGALLPRFKPVYLGRRKPSGYPFDLVLPEPIGNKNDFGFLMEAINQLGCAGDVPDRSLCVVVWIRSRADLHRLAQGLALQTLPRERFTVIAFVDTEEVASPVAWADQTFKGHPWRNARQEDVWLKDRNADVIVFLDGRGCLECDVLERVTRNASVSIPLVTALLSGSSPGTDGAQPDSPPQRIVEEWRLARFPFSKMHDFNFAISRDLLEEIGGFDPRFRGIRRAVMELCYRAYNLGAYFIPIPVAKSSSAQASLGWDWEAEVSDDHLFQDLCPVSWYRRGDGTYEIPKVSIYIPAYNAEEFICDAIDSVLDQDFEDLEVCIHVDGASDGTLKVLEENYSGNNRVRWSVDKNAGIGRASNRAIGLSRGLYVAQLDSDDRLRPGAVKRLVEFLDHHADVGCVYSSCVRIDRSGRYLRDEYSWPVFSREKMILMSIVHHFRMFRRQAWERTEKFREDMTNAVDYDMFLKMSDVTEFHHIEEKLYERRWHGGNTSDVNEDLQTRNTHLAQTRALERLGLAAGWRLSIPDRSRPRKITYTRKSGRKRVVFWPDCTLQDPYQRLLYCGDIGGCDFISGGIEVAIRMAREAADPDSVFFHLHSAAPLLHAAEGEAEARRPLDSFLESVRELQGLGGTVIWTMHGSDTADAGLPLIAAAVDRVHVHSESLIPALASSLDIPPTRFLVTRHGSYRRIYPDFVPRELARQRLGLSDTDITILCFGNMYSSESLRSLFRSCEKLVREGHPLSLIVVGEASCKAWEKVAVLETLGHRVRFLDRRIDDTELQNLFRAADVGVLPGHGSRDVSALMLSFSFGLPVVAPSDEVTREVLSGLDAGLLYGPGEASPTLVEALRRVVVALGQGDWELRRANALRKAEDAWPDFMAAITSPARGTG